MVTHLIRAFNQINLVDRKTRSMVELAVVGGLVIVSFFLLPISGVNINNNSALYLIQASNILRGQDPGLTFSGRSARGPVFPLLIAMGFLLNGESVYIAVLVMRFFFAAGIVLSYFVGKTLFGRAVGLLTACLVLSSYGLNLISGFLDTDIVLPVFVLLFLLVYHLSLDRATRTLTLAAGLCLGFSILVKESAVVFVILPLLLPVFTASRRRSELWKRCLFLYIGLLAVVLPWVVAVIVRYGSPMVILGVMNPEIQHRAALFAGFKSPLLYWLNLFTLGAFPALISYFETHLLRAISVAHLAIFAWLFLIGRAVRRQGESDLILVLSAVLFLPIVLRVGDVPAARLGQSSIFFFLSYLAIGAALVATFEFVITKAKLSHPTRAWVRFGGISLITILLTAYQLLHSGPGGLSTHTLWIKGGKGIYPLSFLKQVDFKVGGRFTGDQEAVARWLKGHVPQGSSIVADGYSQEAMDFFLLKAEGIPVFHPVTTLALWSPEPLPAEQVKENLLYAMTYTGFQRGGKQYLEIYLVFQEDVVATLEKNKADYLVISGRGNYIRRYLDSVPWAELQFQAGSVSVYAIRRNAADFNPNKQVRSGPMLHLRSGDGTIASFTLNDKYRRYEVPGKLMGVKKNMFFYIDRPGVFYLDEVSFSQKGADGRTTNLLSAANSGFEADVSWGKAGNHSAKRVKDGEAPEGSYVLEVTATAPGSGSDRVDLSADNYAYERGQPNVLTFYARSASLDKFFCVNKAFEDDLVWLEKNYPQEYTKLLEAFRRLNLDRNSLKQVNCRIPDEQAL